MCVCVEGVLNSVQRDKIIARVHLLDYWVLGIFCLKSRSFSYLFHQYQLQGPVSSGTLTGLTNILVADSFVKRLDTFQITATYSKHWVQVEINKCCRQYGFTSYSTNLANRNLVKREDRGQREEMWHRERLYLEATKWEQEEVMAKGKNLSLPWSALHATQYFKSHNWESFSNFPWVPREQDLGSQ